MPSRPPVDERQVGLDTVSTKMMSTGESTYGRARLIAPAVPSQRLLLDELRRDVVMLDDVSLHRLLEVSGDDDELFDVEPLHRVHE